MVAGATPSLTVGLLTRSAIMIPRKRIPRNGKPSRMQPCSVGRMILSVIIFSSPAVSRDASVIVPMPPVLGPVSPSPMRLWSRTGGISAKSSPSTNISSDTSLPTRHSSRTILSAAAVPTSAAISLIAAIASARFAATTTPLPAARPSAFTTTGVFSSPKSPLSSSRIANSGECAVTNFAVGTPCRTIKFFENDLLASSWAASLFGPIIFRPRDSNSSTIPRASDVSPPTNVRSIPLATAKAASPRVSSGLIGTHCATSAMPALPLAQKSPVTRALLLNERQIACSRPPEPITRIFIWYENEF